MFYGCFSLILDTDFIYVVQVAFSKVKTFLWWPHAVCWTCCFGSV